VVVAERIWREVSARPAELESFHDGAASVPKRASTMGPPAEPARPDAGYEGGSAPKPLEARPSRPPAEGGVLADPRWADGPRQITVSIGVALYPSRDVRTKDALIRAAEAALSQAKREGGNRICVFQQQGYIYSPAIGSAKVGGDAPPSSRGRLPSDSWRPAPESERGRRGS
jgi:GGDEF domain-containing protein